MLLNNEWINSEIKVEIKKYLETNENEQKTALAGVVQWIECRPVKQRVDCSNLSQGTCLGYGPGPQKGAHKRQPHIDVSLPLFLPPFPCKNK